MISQFKKSCKKHCGKHITYKIAQYCGDGCDIDYEVSGPFLRENRISFQENSSNGVNNSSNGVSNSWPYAPLQFILDKYEKYILILLMEGQFKDS